MKNHALKIMTVFYSISHGQLIMTFSINNKNFNSTSSVSPTIILKLMLHCPLEHQNDKSDSTVKYTK